MTKILLKNLLLIFQGVRDENNGEKEKESDSDDESHAQEEER